MRFGEIFKELLSWTGPNLIILSVRIHANC